MFLLMLNEKKLCAKDRLCNFCKSSVLVNGAEGQLLPIYFSTSKYQLKRMLISNLPYFQVPELHPLH